MSSDLLQGEVLVGFTVSLANIAIHAIMMAVLVWMAHHASYITRSAHPRLRLQSAAESVHSPPTTSEYRQAYGFG